MRPPSVAPTPIPAAAPAESPPVDDDAVLDGDGSEGDVEGAVVSASAASDVVLALMVDREVLGSGSGATVGSVPAVVVTSTVSKVVDIASVLGVVSLVSLAASVMSNTAE